ncbi:hypothetical protein A8926_6608 [Saccharopolyspora spinosa]|uniref:Uncharacterized protein n=1 Tax=Saccharopolyspora spinosa TaxID=60894 RepID=A0A2N3Y6F9_SACSN|nr:hypothetical protein A8926_6608 [Saccharopolyspora spinosa]
MWTPVRGREPVSPSVICSRRSASSRCSLCRFRTAGSRGDPGFLPAPGFRRCRNSPRHTRTAQWGRHRRPRRARTGRGDGQRNTAGSQLDLELSGVLGGWRWWRTGRGPEPFHVQVLGESRGLCHIRHRPQHAFRSTAIEGGFVRRLRDIRGQIRQAMLVLWLDVDHTAGHPHELGQKRHACPGPATVEQRPRLSRFRDRSVHGEDGGDPDATGDDSVRGCVDEPEVVAGPPRSRGAYPPRSRRPARSLSHCSGVSRSA